MASRVLGVSLLIASACSAGRDASLTVVIDSNGTHEEREVIAVPVDPASLHSSIGSAAGISPRHADSVARLAALRDSAVTYNERFQSERDTLNRESHALDRVDRRAAEYARRFDAFRRRALAAESLRIARDRFRDRIAPLAERLSGGAAPTAAADSSFRSILETVSATGRRSVVGRTRSDTVRLRLAAGTWWIGASGAGTLPSRWTKVEMPHAGVMVLEH
jgi:hypothetical protein